MRFPLGALAVTLGAQHRLHVDSVRRLRAVVAGVEQQMSAAIEVARQPVDPAAIRRLETAAAGGAAKRAAELARAANLRTFLLAGTITAVAVLAAGAGGFWWGRHTQAVEIASTEAGITAAFRDGPGAAAAWLNFMQANDGNLVRDVCAKSTVKTPDGRHPCAVGLWGDLPPNPPPRTEPIRR